MPIPLPIPLPLPTGQMELRPASDTDAAAMGWLAHDLLPPHERHFTPGLSSRRGPTQEVTARSFLQRTWANRSELCTENWTIPFAVVIDGNVVGMQAIHADDFPVSRTVRTGSFLAASARSRGVGTAMRALVVEFCIAQLGAHTMVTGHMVDNLASQRVSQKLGYEFVATEQQEFGGAHHAKHVLSLSAQRWTAARPPWLDAAEFTGVEPVLALLGCAGAGAGAGET